MTKKSKTEPEPQAQPQPQPVVTPDNDAIPDPPASAPKTRLIVMFGNGHERTFEYAPDDAASIFSEATSMMMSQDAAAVILRPDIHEHTGLYNRNAVAAIDLMQEEEH